MFPDMSCSQTTRDVRTYGDPQAYKMCVEVDEENENSFDLHEFLVSIRGLQNTDDLDQRWHGQTPRSHA